jgi:hypothetical protein
LIAINAVWLRNVGDRLQVLIETNEGWRLAIDTFGPLTETQVSHIAELAGLVKAPADPITEDRP